ncbi:MAG TPA: FecR domain-containing protein, partial [Sphingomicrobium sp.]|nr:FecR domain-containing protein [Sphingomicrobium sp.]
MRLLLIAALLVGTAANGAPVAKAPDFLYVVRPGDTLIDLAKRGFRREGDYVVAQRHNQIANPRRLQPGSTLHIPERILKTRAIGAKVVAFRGDAMVSGSPAQLGIAVAEGAMLKTGADAFLTIALADGSLITLPSRSTMKVSGLHRVVLTGNSVKTFDLLEGRSETQVQKARQPNDRFEIHTPVSVAAVRGTKFRVTFGQEKAIAGAGVLEGTVAIGAGNKSLSLPAGNGVTASADGPGEPAALLPRPTLQNPDRVQDEDEVRFAVVPLPGASTYRVQLASDAGFIEIFAEAVSPTDTFGFKGVPNGTFFARATALSDEGIEGFPAVYSFERRLNTITAEVGKPDQCPATRCLRFRWRSGGEGDHRYRFQLASRPGGTPIIDQLEMTSSEIVLTDLPGGTYYWRVESNLLDGGRR